MFHISSKYSWQPIVKHFLYPNSFRCSFSVNANIQSQSSPKPILDTSLRISKIISQTGICTRREAERWINAGRVRINEEVVKSAVYIIDPSDKVYLDNELLVQKGKKVNQTLPKLWMVHKLKEELVAHSDVNRNRPLLFSRLHNIWEPSQLCRVQYLGFSAEGLQLVTNDTQLAKALMRPDINILKSYRIRINGVISDSKIMGLRKGMYIDGKKQPSIILNIETTSKTMSWVHLSTFENNINIIKKCLEFMHLNVTRIISIGFGPYELGTLPKGSYLEVKITPEIYNVYRDQCGLIATNVYDKKMQELEESETTSSNNNTTKKSKKTTTASATTTTTTTSNLKGIKSASNELLDKTLTTFQPSKRINGKRRNYHNKKMKRFVDSQIRMKKKKEKLIKKEAKKIREQEYELRQQQQQQQSVLSTCTSQQDVV